MNKKLNLELNAAYPEMFIFSNLRSADYFVIECGDGWYNILNALFRQIGAYIKNNNDRVNRFEEAQDLIDNGRAGDVPLWILTEMERFNNRNDEYPQMMDYPVPNQIKEKFGILRIHMAGDAVITALISLAQSMSVTTCEACGDLGKIHSGGWLKTLCLEHEEERQQEKKERHEEINDTLNAMTK